MRGTRTVSKGKIISSASNQRTRMCGARQWQTRICCGTFVVLCSVLSICLTGCGDKFFDPTQIGRFRPTPAVNVILDSLGVAEETPSAWEGAEDPRPIDVVILESDYLFGPGDIVRVSIFELLQEGVLFVNDYPITESGKLSIPEVGVIDAAGLTESQLEEELRQILEPSILKEPSVTVTLLGSPRRAFSILGNGVPRPNRYSLPRYSFRLADAIAIAGGISEFNVSYIYVSRAVTGEALELVLGEPETGKPGTPDEKLIVPEQEMLEIIAPQAEGSPILRELPFSDETARPASQEAAESGLWQLPQNKLVMASAEMVTGGEFVEVALPEGLELPADGKWRWTGVRGTGGSSREPTGRQSINEPIGEEKTERIEWVFQDGRWVPVRIGPPRPWEPSTKVWPDRIPVEDIGKPLKERAPADFDWDEIGTGGVQTRVIKIPVDRFQAGDPQYNIVVRPGDTIYVPVDVIGEFYVMGNTVNRGAIPLTGRPMTLKMAIAAAGGLGPLAWPKRCEVIRRLGKDREEIVMVDLDKIASGEQPDFFIKPDDLINVGTHPTARWRAVLRNAFRATYGFGFIYDRNFADRDFGTRRPIPDWF